VPDPAQAVVSDNCGTPDVSVSESSNGGSGTPDSPLVLTRLYSATDSAGGSGSDSQTITVKDTTAPLVSLTGGSTLTVECHGHFEDPGATANDNCGGDLSSEITVSGSVDITVPGTYTLVYSVRDAAGNLGSATRTVHVVDTEAPTLALLGDNPLTVECHSVFSDPGAVALDDCEGDLGSQIVVTGGVNTEVTGVYTLTYTVSDKAGNTASANRTVIVVATPPEVTITGPESGAIFAVGTPVTFSGSFSDRDSSGHTAVWTVGGTSLEGTVDESQGTVTATTTFSAAGVYKVTLTVTDACGAAGSADTVNGLAALVVIYDPSAGFVTGGGFINSPPGAYSGGPALTGKANFGFVSRYQGGAAAPSGQTEFQFKAGDLNFHASVYDWLVVSGPLAQYTGTGTLNGGGRFGFVVTVLDGQSNGGGNVDRLRMKIWDETTGALVYDTQPGAADGAVPTTPLAGGNVVIHN
jgi:hypothetical protein